MGIAHRPMRPVEDARMEVLLAVAANIFVVPLVLVNSALAAVGCVVVLGTGLGLAVGLTRALGVELSSVGAAQAAMAHTVLTLFSGHVERVGGLSLAVRGERLDSTEERALVLCNHRSWVDTAVLFSLARHADRLTGMRFVADSSLLRVPIVGALSAVLDVAFVIERSARAAGGPLSRAYARLQRASRKGLPFWLVLYPEGYLRSPAKLRAAREFALARGLRPLAHLQQPRTKGFVAAVAALRGDIDAVYDVTIAYGDQPYDPVTPSIFSLYFTLALAPRVVHVHTRRIPLNVVPKDEEDAKAWMYKLFEEKDKLLDDFYKNKRFPGNNVGWERVAVSRMLVHVALSFVVVAFVGGIALLMVMQLGATHKLALTSSFTA